MPVQPVTPMVPAIGGGLQFYRDLDFYDAAQDERTTGEDIFTSEWPDKPLRLKPTRGTDSTAGARTRSSGIPDARERGSRVSLDGRSALSPSSPDRGLHTPGSGLAACEAALSGAPEILLHTNSGASNPSEQSRPGWSPDGS